MKKENVFFDFFGVICSEISPVWLRKYFDDETAVKIKSELFPLADIGLISEEETFERLYEITSVPVDRIKEEWSDLIIINEALVGYIDSLKDRYNVYLLSNAISSFIDRILSDHDLSRLFLKTYISSEIGIIKPDKAFFDYVLTDLGVPACSAVMIDDNPDNIKGAESAGIDGIVFTEFEPFLTEIDKYLL